MPWLVIWRFEISGLSVPQARLCVLQTLYQYSPLVILNNFGETLPSTPKHLSLSASMFQGLFPPLDVGAVKLSQCRRVVLFHYDKEKDLVEFRHYAVKVVASGLTRG
jgi:ribosome biogenesis protein SSF1/2